MSSVFFQLSKCDSVSNWKKCLCWKEIHFCGGIKKKGGWGNILIYAFATIDGKQTHRLYSSICNKTKL